MKSTNNAFAKPIAFLAVGAVVGALVFAVVNKTAEANGPFVYQPMQRTASMHTPPTAPSGDLESLDRFYSDLMWPFVMAHIEE